MNILNFLSYWANRVYEWFGWLYESGRNAALYALIWAMSEANLAFIRAKQFIYDKANEIYANVNAWIWARYYEAKAIIDAAANFAKRKRDELISWAQAEILKAIIQAIGLFNTAKKLAKQGIDDLSVTVYTQVNKVRDEINAMAHEVKGIVGGVQTNITETLSRDYSWLIAKDANGNPILSTMLSNPLGFIMAFIMSVFTDLVSVGLGYGMGSVKYDLPQPPPWTSPGTSGGYIPPVSLPVPPGALGPPLDTIYVSGYTFTASHKAIDLGLVDGDPVYAMRGGTVQVAGFSNVGYGLQVVISDATWWIRYAHLKNLGVVVNQQVRAGQGIGQGDSTGNSSGPHLHLEIKRDGVFIDPLTVL